MRYCLLMAVALIGFACDSEESFTPTEAPDPVSLTVDFQRPVVGQRNIYDSFQFVCGQLEDARNTEITLTVTAVSESLLELTETYADSTLVPVILHAVRVPGNLIISADERARSSLLYFYGSDSLRLDAASVATLDYRDCVFYDADTIFTGDYIASVPEFTFNELSFSDLKVASCVPFVDLDGYLLYTERNLVASVTATRWGIGTSSTTIVVLRGED